jgi:hypothetical protein
LRELGHGSFGTVKLVQMNETLERYVNDNVLRERIGNEIIWKGLAQKTKRVQ